MKFIEYGVCCATYRSCSNLLTIMQVTMHISNAYAHSKLGLTKSRLDNCKLEVIWPPQ